MAMTAAGMAPNTLSGHDGEPSALAGIDGSYAEIDGDALPGYVKDDPESTLHLFLVEHVELAVAPERKDAVDP